MKKKIKAILAVTVLGLFALLPLSLSQKLGSRLALFVGRKQSSNLYRVTSKNIEMCFPELDRQQKEQLIHESIKHTGIIAAEAGMSWLWPPSWTLKKVRNVHGEDLIHETLDSGRGVLLIAPHLGNWEVLNLYVSSNHPTTAMYRPPKLKLLDDIIKRMRARLGTKLAPANSKGVRTVLKSLKSGELVGILPDQEPDSAGVFVPFYGHDAYTMKLFPQLVKQTGARVFTGVAERLPNAQGFDIYFEEADDDIYSKELQVSASALNRMIEKCVNRCPAQYQWEYKRFHKQPNGVCPYKKK